MSAQADEDVLRSDSARRARKGRHGWCRGEGGEVSRHVDL